MTITANLLINQAGTWTIPTAVSTNIGGVWTPVTSVWQNHGGVWEKHWPIPQPPPPGCAAIYDTPGYYSYVVDLATESLTVSVIAGGGGAGACDSSGDAWVGYGGGSGGHIDSQVITVVPGETLTIFVGAGGGGASYRFNSYYNYNHDYYGNQVGTGTGNPGQDSVIYRDSTVLVYATGGGPGYQFYHGSGGSPGGTDSYNSGGASNGTGYGSGGSDPGLAPGQNGQNGAVLICWP